MQPVQLSLLPDQVPAPPPALLAQLPDTAVAAAVMLLAGLIARAAGQHLVPVPSRRGAAGDE